MAKDFMLSIWLSSAVAQRLTAYADFTACVNSLKTQEDALVQKLVAATRKQLKVLVSEYEIPRTLIAHGSIAFTLVYSEQPKGFKNAEQVRARIAELRKDWADAFDASFSVEEPRIKVKLYVKHP